MDFGRAVKIMAASRGLSIAKVCDLYNERYGTKYYQSYFSRKLNKRMLTFDEFVAICDILGYSLTINDKETDEQILPMPL